MIKIRKPGNETASAEHEETTLLVGFFVALSDKRRRRRTSLKEKNGVDRRDRGLHQIRADPARPLSGRQSRFVNP